MLPSAGVDGMGSSPRVRSRRAVEARRPDFPGIISACAEQTSWSWSCAWSMRDHLRVCGADSNTKPPLISCAGSSPRVRSRLLVPVEGAGRRGIISACAEQTPSGCRTCQAARDHLRVCGADHRMSLKLMRMRGSSPRVRSRHQRVRLRPRRDGIISACAEQTRSIRISPANYGDHLRVCGADVDTRV